MTVGFQLVIDCRDPEPLARFWAAALGYEFEPPPEGFATWDDYWRDVGVGAEDLGIGQDCIIDPDGGGLRIWFQVVPEVKTVKNRLHLDISVSGGRAFPIETRRQRVDAEAQRLAGLGASYVRVLSEEGLDHYGIAMQDPEGNEFDINCALTAYAQISPLHLAFGLRGVRRIQHFGEHASVGVQGSPTYLHGHRCSGPQLGRAEPLCRPARPRRPLHLRRFISA